MARTHAEQIASRSIEAARKLLGPGWCHVSQEIRRGLVDTQILGVILGQDESLPVAKVLGYLRELSGAADAILDAEDRPARSRGV